DEMNAVVELPCLQRFPFVGVEPQAGAAGTAIDDKAYAVSDVVPPHDHAALGAELGIGDIDDLTDLFRRVLPFAAVTAAVDPLIIHFAADELSAALLASQRCRPHISLRRIQFHVSAHRALDHDIIVHRRASGVY